ncbi:hypothetical protein MFLAVUS_004503 [Mucor flavus]|uniref:Protein FAM72A n=1 Tax=Mucor flavus TaxID=439312 RepID=A0ABP9YW33_9FUNG
MESARVRLPRPRNSSAYNDTARRLSNEEQRRSSFQRFTFPNITPPSVVQSQRRSSQQHVRASQYINDHPGLVTPIKPVYKLNCRHCSTTICARGMKAILLADTTIELYSTDTPSQSIHVLEKDYLTRSCHCRIRDVACLECGNVIGYHVVSPCSQCLDACNNGHFWMFHSSACQPAERHDRNKQIMLWNNLPRAEMDMEFMMGTRIPYDQLCR